MHNKTFAFHKSYIEENYATEANAKFLEQMQNIMQEITHFLRKRANADIFHQNKVSVLNTKRLRVKRNEGKKL